MSLKDNTISLQNAEAWTANWRKRYPENSSAYLIPAEDLSNVLIEMGILKEEKTGMYSLNLQKGQDIRAYMAQDPNQIEGNGEKLVLVGTKNIDGIYRDIINGKIDNEGEVLHPTLNAGTGLYDLTQPCRPHCDPNSPLNQ